MNDQYKHRHQPDSCGGCPFHDALASCEFIQEIMEQSNAKRVEQLTDKLNDLLCEEQLVDGIAALFLELEAAMREAVERT